MQAAPLEDVNPSDGTASPLFLGAPFKLQLNWWKDRAGRGATLKPWAGTMRGGRIARAMRARLNDCVAQPRPLDHGMVVLGPDEKKVEPFYFDGRRGANALALDVGFSTDAVQLETYAFPAVEFLSLVGLQRFRPRSEARPRVFSYSAWRSPLPIFLASVAAAGEFAGAPVETFRFENAFRTDQRKHKAFTPAVSLNGAER